LLFYAATKLIKHSGSEDISVAYKNCFQALKFTKVATTAAAAAANLCRGNKKKTRRQVARTQNGSRVENQASLYQKSAL